VQLNFSAFREHRTVEQRLLPMFRNERLALLALKETLDIFETFLAAHPGRTVQVAADSWNAASSTEDMDGDDLMGALGGVLASGDEEVEIQEYPPVREGETRVPACMLPAHLIAA
jgi:hypothetical protein